MVETVRFKADDGWQLSGDLYRGPSPERVILISGATGYARGFYGRVAQWLADQGSIVLTYDYRGIGGSASGDLAGSDIDYPDWGRFDLTAAIQMLNGLEPNLPILHLAHSVGGHFVGLAPNQDLIRKHAFVSVGTGFIGGHHWKQKMLGTYFWWVMGPWSLYRHGYIKPVGGWRGEPLPPILFRTWRRWSHRRSYFKPELDTDLAPQNFDKVTAPIRSWVFSDDPIATASTASDILSCYPNSPQELIYRTPSDLGVRRIGHDGGFRSGREALWQEILEFFDS